MLRMASITHGKDLQETERTAAAQQLSRHRSYQTCLCQAAQAYQGGQQQTPPAIAWLAFKANRPKEQNLKIHTVDIVLTAEQSKHLGALKEVFLQQSALAQKKEVKHRIVTIDRPYIRPIVRGKENKHVEFGAKINNIQIDGIAFIEHHSFEAFNEGVRLKEKIEYHQELTGTKVTRVGADTIYANNDSSVTVVPIHRYYQTLHNDFLSITLLCRFY